MQHLKQTVRLKFKRICGTIIK